MAWVCACVSPSCRSSWPRPPADRVVARRRRAPACARYLVSAAGPWPLFNVLVVAQRNRKKTRMTKELKDENKSADSNPLGVKSQRRSMARSTRNRMIAAVGRRARTSSSSTRPASRCRAAVRGRGAPRGASWRRAPTTSPPASARRPRSRGCEIVQRAPLARALARACDVGQEVPVELYMAVARVPARSSWRSRAAARRASSVPHRMARPAIRAGEWPAADTRGPRDPTRPSRRRALRRPRPA